MYKKVDKVVGLTPEQFKNEYMGKKSVVFTESTGSWIPSEVLNLNNILKHSKETEAKVRPRRNGYLATKRITEYMSVEQYYSEMETWYSDVSSGKTTKDSYPPYLHDTPILKNAPQLAKEIQNFPLDYLPNWYSKDWYKFCLFFIGPSKGTTPLHFDSCETNNLFFQVSGTKKFIIVPENDKLEPFRLKWQWSSINAEAPSEEEEELLQSVGAFEVILEPNDILYMPPRTWHQVRMVEPGVSFNIDWHTKQSSLRSLTSLVKKSPVRNAFNYNLPLTLGLWLGVPSSILYPWLQKHLDFVD